MEYFIMTKMSERRGLTSRRIAVLCGRYGMAIMIKRKETAYSIRFKKPEDAGKNNCSRRGVLEC